MAAASRSGNRRWAPLVVCPHKELGRGLRAALTERGVEDAAMLSSYPARGTAASYAAPSGCNICFLDLATNAEEGLPLIRELAACMPVVVVNISQDADLILRSLRNGACEFLSHPVTGEQVGLVLARLATLQAAPDPEPGGSVFCVVPGKAGCGATTFATQLAASLRTLEGKRVLLADLDTLSGTVGFLWKLKGEHQLQEVLGNWKRMDPDLWNHLVTTAHGLDVLVAPAAPALLELDRPTVQDMFGFWRRQYAYVVADTAGAGSATARHCAALADTVILVSTNELAALHATRRAAEWLEQGGLDRSHIRLVLNRYLPGTGLKAEDVHKALGLEVFATIHNEYQLVQQAIWEGVPVPASSAVGHGITRCAARLLGRDLAPSPKTGSWRRIFSRRK